MPNLDPTTVARAARAGLEAIGDAGWLPADMREAATERELKRAEAIIRAYLASTHEDHP